MKGRRQIIGVISLLVALAIYWQQSQRAEQTSASTKEQVRVESPRGRFDDSHSPSVAPSSPASGSPSDRAAGTLSDKLSGGNSGELSGSSSDKSSDKPLGEFSSFSTVISARKSEHWMKVSVRVIKTLPDDNEGSRHQRFLVEGGDGNTVLVAHNIDLAKKIPLKRNDILEIRGRYEWNEKGGVLHWTHGDPSGRKEGGWIRHRGKEYR